MTTAKFKELVAPIVLELEVLIDRMEDVRGRGAGSDTGRVLDAAVGGLACVSLLLRAAMLATSGREVTP